MEQANPLDFEQLLNQYRYHYTKPNAQLRTLLQTLPVEQYPQLMRKIIDYDTNKVKRLLRVLKQPQRVKEYFILKLKHGLKINEIIPEGIVDVKKTFTLQGKSSTQDLMNRLKEEYLIDSKNRKLDALHFKYYMYTNGSLSDDEIQIIIENALRLLKRSENNMDTLYQILIELSKTNYDISKNTQLIQNALQEFQKNDLTILCLKELHYQIKDDNINNAISCVAKLIEATHDENRKFAYLNTLPCKGDKQIDIIYNLATLLNDEIKTFELADRFNKLNIPLGNIAHLKKLLNMNKHTNAFVCLILVNQLLNQKQEANTKDIEQLIEIILSGLVNNFKNFAKVVTQTVMFLAQLKCIILYALYCEEDAPAKLMIGINEALNKNTNIFQPKSHLCQLKYLTSQSCQQESQLYLDCLLIYQAIIYDENEQFNYLLPMIILIGFSGKIKNSINFKSSLNILKEFTQKQDGIELNIFFDKIFITLHNFLYLINPNQNEGINFRRDRLSHFVRLIILESKNIELSSYWYIYTTISHSFINSIKTKLNKHEININPLKWFTNNGLQSNNPYTVKSIINLCSLLCNLGYSQEILIPLEPIITPNNITKLNSLDEIEETLENIQLEKLDSQSLQDAGLKWLSNERPIDQLELQLQQELKKFENNDAVLMDENEAKQQMLQKQKTKICHFFNLTLQLFSGIKSQSFVSKYFDAITQFTKEELTRYQCCIYILQYCETNQLLQQFKWPLMYFFLEKSLNQVPNDKICEKINQFQDAALIKQPPLHLLHLLNLYIIKQNSFTIATKFKTFQIILKYGDQLNLEDYFQPFVENINICGHPKNAFQVLSLLYKNTQNQQILLFNDILNLVPEAQNLILQVINTLPDNFDISIKVRVLAQFEETKNQAIRLLDSELDTKDLIKWNLAGFVSKFPREHSERMIDILHSYEEFATMIHQAAAKLIKDQNIQEEQLEFFPYYVSQAQIPSKLVSQTIDLLIAYSSNPQNLQLNQVCKEAGFLLIENQHKQAQDILKVIENHLQKTNTNASIRAISFLGVLSQYLQGHNQRKTQEQIVQLFRTSNQEAQVQLAQSLSDLLTFFPDTENLVIELLKTNKTIKDEQIKRGNSYMIAGLVKGLGVEIMEKLKILEILEMREKKETVEDKQNVLIQLKALIQLFGMTLEPYVLQVMGILMHYFGEGRPEIRNLAMDNASHLLQSLSSYGVKIMLQPLLQGLDQDTQWRGKVANIWALGHLAHCSPKQLSSCLPQIVNSISKAISDTHPDVKAEANKSLNEIGSTIKNPEISSIADILIISLSNPYDENIKGLQVVLQTKFRHFIDAPAMSLLIPIIDYGLKAQDSEQRQLASILIGGLPHLIQKSEDLVPYMDLITGGLEIVIGDPLLEVRTLAAKAIGQISKKIGIENTKRFFKFIWDILENKDASTNKRSGAAHSLAEISCIHNEQYLEEQLNYFFQQIQRPEPFIKEGYIGIFIYIPSILQKKFENYVKDVIENVYECVSHDDDVVNSITLRVLKILIKNFGVLQNELLYPSLTETMLNEDAKKRNAGTILSGEMLKITQRLVLAQINNPNAPQYINIDLYYLNLMTLYTMQQDVADLVRQNAVSIWKEFIDNTPKTLKAGLKQYIYQLCTIMSKDGVFLNGCNSVKNFCEKYSETQLSEAFKYIGEILKNENNLSIIRGAYSVLNQIYIQTTLDIVGRYSDQFIEFSRTHIFCTDTLVKQQIFISIGTMINKVKQTTFVELLIEPYLNELSTMTENDSKYDLYLEVFSRLCELNQTLVLHYLIVLILVPPLYQFKIDILTNNASTFAAVIYKKYDNKIPIQVLFADLYNCATLNNQEWDDRTESLIYCISQLSVFIKQDQENSQQTFIYDMLNQISNRSKLIFEGSLDNYKYCLLPLEILSYYLQNTTEDYQRFSQAILEKITPFIYFHSTQLATFQLNRLYTLANKIISTINNTLDKQYHFDNMRNLHTCFLNRIEQQIPGLNTQESTGIEPYISMLIDCIVYGKEETFKYAYDVMKILLKEATTESLQTYILKLIGALIRILNYKGNNEIKMYALQIIELSVNKGLKLSQFKPQLAITYEKLVTDLNIVKGGLKQLTKNYSQFLQYHDKKDLLLNQLFNKVVQSTTLEMRECHLKIVKKAIKNQRQEQIFSSALLERIFTIGKQYYEKIISNQRFDLASPNELNSLAHVLALTYNYTNKNNKEQYVQKYLKFETYGIILKLQFVRYHLPELLQDTVDFAIQSINTTDNLSYALQLIRTLRKLPIKVHERIKHNFNTNSDVLFAMDRLK